MFRSLAVCFALCSFSNAAWPQTCADVRQIDFRNATIHIGSLDANERKTEFDGPAPSPDLFRLHNGVALINQGSSTPDWQVDLVADRVVHPDPSTWLRVVVLDKDHLTGTGTWDFILAFGCSHGSLVRLFQYSSEGVSLKHLDDQNLLIYQAIWKPEDAHCCPGSHIELSYQWSPRQHRYRRVAAVPGDGMTSIPDEK